MSLTLLYASAFLLGSTHAFGPDHVAAVTMFALRRPGPRGALEFGVRWAAGHGLVVFVVGAVLALVGARLPASAAALAEVAVGLTLVVMGVWALVRARGLARHVHAFDPVAASGTTRHAPAAIGMLHGLAGNGAVIALVPIAAAGATAHAFGFLVTFAAGTTLAMAAYAAVAGVVLQRSMMPSERAARRIARLAGGITILIGLAWVFGWNLT